MSASRAPQLVTAWISTSITWLNWGLSHLGCASSSLSKQSCNPPCPSQHERFFDLGSGLVALPIWHLLSPRYIFRLHVLSPCPSWKSHSLSHLLQKISWFLLNQIPSFSSSLEEDLFGRSLPPPPQFCPACVLFRPALSTSLQGSYHPPDVPGHSPSCSAMLPRQRAAQEGLHGRRSVGLCSPQELGLFDLRGAVTASKAPSRFRSDHGHLQVLSAPTPGMGKPFWEAA